MAIDPFDRLKLWVGISVTGVWTVTFLALLIRPEANQTALVSVQAAMLLVLGGMYGARLIRRNGGSSK